MDKNYLDAYRQLKEDYPEAYTALAVLPVSGQVAAIADYAEAIDRGDSKDAALAAASLIPGIKMAKMGSKLAPPSIRLTSQMNDVEKVIAPVTKRAPAIGKMMGAEQVAEYATKPANAAPVDKDAQDKQAYYEAWKRQEHAGQ